MDQLQIKDLEIFAYHGLFPSEKELGAEVCRFSHPIL